MTFMPTDGGGGRDLFSDPTTMLLLGLGQEFSRMGQPGGNRQPFGQSLMQAMIMGGQARDSRELKDLQRRKLTFEMEQAQSEAERDAKLMAMFPGMFSGQGGQGGGAPPPVGAPGAGMPTAAPGGGISDFNIGNVRPVGGGPNSGFQQPPTLDDGIRLTVNNARSYPGAFNQGQSMTLVQIGQRWAPKGDGANDPLQWAKNVAAISGLPIDQPIDLSNPNVAAQFARGVHGAEKGGAAALPPDRYLNAIVGAPGVPQGDSPRPQADASGNPLPPQSAANVPADIPRVRQTDPMQWLPFLLSKKMAPIGQAGIAIGNQQDTNQRSDRASVLVVDMFGYQKLTLSSDATESKRRWETEQTREQEREEFARKHNGEWVRGPDGADVFVPRAQMGPDVRRYDKPPEPATEVGDYRVLATADPGSREYAAAYNRLGNTMIDVGNGQKRPPNMRAFAAPTFQEPSAAPEAPPGPQGTQKEMQDLRTARTEAQTIISALEDFRREFTNDKGLRSVMGFTTPANTSYNAAALLAKGEALFNLGVLNGPDLEIIRRTLPDPSTLRGAGTKPKEMNIAVDKVISLLNTRLAAKEAQLGISPQSGGGVQPAPAPQNGGATPARPAPIRIDINGNPL